MVIHGHAALALTCNAPGQAAGSTIFASRVEPAPQPGWSARLPQPAPQEWREAELSVAAHHLRIDHQPGSRSPARVPAVLRPGPAPTAAAGERAVRATSLARVRSAAAAIVRRLARRRSGPPPRGGSRIEPLKQQRSRRDIHVDESHGTAATPQRKRRASFTVSSPAHDTLSAYRPSPRDTGTTSAV